MASYARQEYKCCFCGNVSEHDVVIGVTTLRGAPDLDLRPVEMKRSTMAAWVQSCPSCGYVAGDLSHASNPTTEIVTDLVRSPAYQALIDGSLASPFLRMVMIADAVEDLDLAGNCALWSAWVADDAGEVEAARARRAVATERFKALAESVPAIENQMKTLLVDVLRRAGRFDEAIECADNILARSPEEPLASILAFGRTRAAGRDDNCYTIAETRKG